MAQPPGFEIGDKSTVCKRQKAIYRLKQAPRAWYDRLTKTFLSFGFIQSKCDPSLLIYNKSGICLYVLVYVDDIIIAGSSASFSSSLTN